MKILVVDDDIYFRELCRRWLERDGHEVAEASSVLEAVAAGQGCDVIVLDYDLGRESAEDVMRVMNGSGAIPVILVSGVRPGDAAVGRLEEMGIVQYIEKPMRMAQLKEAINRAGAMARNIDLCGEACDKLEAVFANSFSSETC